MSTGVVPLQRKAEPLRIRLISYIGTTNSFPSASTVWTVGLSSWRCLISARSTASRWCERARKSARAV
jgi:hypothetical protein